jgi:hypothetical protein
VKGEISRENVVMDNPTRVNPRRPQLLLDFIDHRPAGEDAEAIEAEGHVPRRTNR